jgi:SAM-dependent methyltransferase
LSPAGQQEKEPTYQNPIRPSDVSATPGSTMSDLYKHPEQYDREHLGDEEDIGFYLSLSRRLAPRRVLELGCGTGRITLPLAQLGFDVVGLDNQPEMLQKAEERRLQTSSEIRQRLQFIQGDMRTWSAGTAFDLILIGLLFSHTGYEVEETFGDYRGRALRADSPVMIMIGRRSG